MSSFPTSLVLLILSIALLLKQVSANYELVVQLHRYRNREHKEKNGYCCERRRCRNHCDNKFYFCLRTRYNWGLYLRCLGLNGIYSDSYNFGGNVEIVFYGLAPWPGSAQLEVTVIDYDLGFDDHVDDIYVPINISAGQSTTRIKFDGIYKNSKLEMSFHLYCMDYFYGASCSTYCHPIDNTDDGHFDCDENGERICLPEWQDPGNHCLTPVCEECNPIGGRCTEPNTCTCHSGWEGTNCSVCTETSSGCDSEGGYCLRPGQCICHDGYGGDNCDIDLNPCKDGPCMHGATCYNDGHGSFTCKCASGYEGRNCAVKCDSDSCTTNGTCIRCEEDPECVNTSMVCLNGGTCQIRDEENETHCECSEGFTGQYCESMLDSCIPNPCRNGGTCQDKGDGYDCICAKGYSGLQCMDTTDYCESQPCQNNGTCVNMVGDYMCHCTVGWEGDNCSKERDECERFKPCKNEANCTDKFDGYECDCPPGFYGADCEIEVDECMSHPCLNGNCTKIPRGSGSSGGYSCNCFEEYTGNNCEIDLNSCRSDPCLHGGTCESKTNGSFECTCPPGYTDFNCGDIDECFHSPCIQGTCMEVGRDYYCACDPGYTGTNCSTPLSLGRANPAQKEQGVANVGAVVGGVLGGVVLLLVAIVFVLLVVCLVRKGRANEYKIVSAAGVPDAGEGYHNPTYDSEFHPAQVVTEADEEGNDFQVEYSRFDNPLYSEDVTVTAPPLSAAYSRTTQPGPRSRPVNATRGNDASSTEYDSLATNSAVPGPVQYDYVSVNKQARAHVKRKSNGVAKNGQLLQDQGDATYDSLREYRT